MSAIGHAAPHANVACSEQASAQRARHVNNMLTLIPCCCVGSDTDTSVSQAAVAKRSLNSADILAPFAVVRLAAVVAVVSHQKNSGNYFHTWADRVQTVPEGTLAHLRDNSTLIIY
jgi:hypothetical protein